MTGQEGVGRERLSLDWTLDECFAGLPAAVAFVFGRVMQQRLILTESNRYQTPEIRASCWQHDIFSLFISMYGSLRTVSSIPSSSLGT